MIEARSEAYRLACEMARVLELGMCDREVAVLAAHLERQASPKAEAERLYAGGQHAVRELVPSQPR